MTENQLKQAIIANIPHYNPLNDEPVNIEVDQHLIRFQCVSGFSDQGVRESWTLERTKTGKIKKNSLRKFDPWS